MTGDCGGVRYHSLVNEDPALAMRGERRQLLSRTPPAAWSEIKKIVVVILENADLDSALALPNFGKFAKRGAFLSNYYGITHPSQ
ncbi:MAG: hypothetical protein ABI041_04230, partial [Bdellovibrionia bacterium]